MVWSMSILDSILLSITFLIFPIENMGKLPFSDHWEVQGDAWELEFEPRFMATLTAKSSKIIIDCKQNPDHIVQMPVSIYGAHEIFLDGKLKKAYGNKEGLGYSKKYQNAFIKCSDLGDASELTWILYSPLYQQAKIKHFPKILPQKTDDVYVNVDLKVSIGVFLILFSVSILQYFGAELTKEGHWLRSGPL